MDQNGIEIAGIEFITDRSGEIYTYDINTNTNYNALAEAEAKLTYTGMQAIARFLGREFENLTMTTTRTEIQEEVKSWVQLNRH